MTPVPAVRGLTFVSLLTSSLLNKIGISWTRVLQEEEIFPMIPRSEWSTQWSLKYPRKFSEIWVKTRCKIACDYTWLYHSKIRGDVAALVRSRMNVLQPFERTIKQTTETMPPSHKTITAAVMTTNRITSLRELLHYWKFARLDDAFSEFFEPEASPVEGQPPQQKEKRRKKMKRRKKIKKRKALRRWSLSRPIITLEFRNFVFFACFQNCRKRWC